MKILNVCIQIATLCLVLIFVGVLGRFWYLIETSWQPIWSDGFSDWGSIAEAIVSLERTTAPVSEIAPLMLSQMNKMNAEIAAMRVAVEGMQYSVAGIHASVYEMSRTVPQGMGQIRQKMSPMSMMPFQ